MKLLAISFLFLSFTSQAATKIKIGWQIPWTIQGQITQVLKHTEILKKNGIEAEFIGRTFGPELNELAMAGAVDIIFTADQPASILFAKSPDWLGVGRLMYNRTSTYVPLSSPIKSLGDLKGKTIGVPFGAAAERIVHEALEEEKISLAQVKFINLGMLEHAPLVKRAKKGASTWDQFDALSGFDPIPAILESENLLRTIHAGKVCALILMNKKIEEKNPGLAQAFLKSVEEAYEYYKNHKEETNAWFLAEAKMPATAKKALEITESLEPNFSHKKIRLSFTEEDFLLMQKGADFATKTLGKKIVMKDFVTNKYAQGK